MITPHLLPKIFAGCLAAALSWWDSANLRNRLYALKEEHEIMWTSLDDISRMDKDGKMGQHAKETLKRIVDIYNK